MARNNEVRIKFSSEEKKKVQCKADQLGMTLSAFVRLVSLNSELHLTST
jgi:antitoxin component of RelBE/YafQ-DinJ toxin-antitoxin module